MSKLQISEDHDCRSESDEVPDVCLSEFEGEISLDENTNVVTEGTCITLDGKITSTLDWTAQIERAKQLALEGKFILWKLDLGLFQYLRHPLNDKGQIQTLKLSLQHFYDAIWEVFKPQTIGLEIYEDSITFDSLLELDLEENLSFNEWLEVHNAESRTPEIAHAYYRRDVAAEFLSILTASAPEGLKLFAEIEIPENFPLSVGIGLLNPDRFEKMEWILQSSHPLNCTWYRKGHKLMKSTSRNSSTGFCIPMAQWMPDKSNEVDVLLSTYENLRLIPEEAIISNWDQLDCIYVLESKLTPFGRRQLKGFQAAGGIVKEVSELG